MKLIHYSSQKIDQLEKREYSQKDIEFQAKPRGLWISVEGENLGYNWKEWCEIADFRIECLVFSYKIILKEDSNILHLKTEEDILEFTKKYRLKTREWDPEWDTYQLDWDEVKKRHQGIIISPYQWECRLALESSWYYGWDCSSGCIWDLDCIQEFNLLKQESLKNECTLPKS